MVAHSMSLIAAQVGVGTQVIMTDPAAAQQTLDVIAEMSRKALERTRAMLAILCEEREDGTRPPTQGLEDLPALISGAKAAGLEVRLGTTDAPMDIDSVVSLAAYRIVQESLTNVIKHLAAATATVTATANDREFRGQIPARGAASATPAEGTG